MILDLIMYGLAILLLLYLWTRKQRVKGCPPGPSWLGSGVVSTMKFLQSVPTAANFYADKYGDVVEVSLWGQRTILISDPEIANHVFNKNPSNYVHRPAVPDGLKKLGMFENGIIWNNDETKWKKLRKVFEHALNNSTLEKSAKIGDEQIRKLLQKHFEKKFEEFGGKKNLEKKSDEKTSPNNGTSADGNSNKKLKENRAKDVSEADLLEMFRLTTLKITLELFMGVTFKDEENIDLVNKIESYFKSWEFFLFRPSWLFKMSKNYRKNCESVKNLFEICEKIISERKKIRSQAGFSSASASKKHKLFLDALLDAQENSERNSMNIPGNFTKTSSGKISDEITHEEVRQCVLEMLIAGTDTSSVTMFYTIILLGEHEEIYAQVLKEITPASPPAPPSPLSPSPPPSPLLDGVIKESLRLKPVGPVIMRKALRNDILPGGYSIEKGTNIIINVARMNLNPKAFNDPQKFDPKRYTNNNPKNGIKPTFPFGEGKKSCAGSNLAKREMDAILRAFFSEAKFKINPKNFLGKLETHWDIAQQPIGKIMVQIFPRKKRIFLCGAHSTGKSTLNSAVRQKFPELAVIEEVARNVMKECGWTKEDFNDLNVRREFQRILKVEQAKMEFQADALGIPYISDRNVIDNLTYCKKYVGDDLVEEFLADPTVKNCVNRYKTSYNFVMKPFPEFNKDDGTRMYERIESLNDFTEKMIGIFAKLEIPFKLIEVSDLQERVNLVGKFLENS